MAYYFKTVGLMLVICSYIFGPAWAEGMAGHNHSASAQSGDPLQEHVELNCSANEAFNRKCFDISKTECLTLLPEIYGRCDQEPSNVLFDAANQESISGFADCVEIELLKHLGAKGVDLDSQCE